MIENNGCIICEKANELRPYECIMFMLFEDRLECAIKKGDDTEYIYIGPAVIKGKKLEINGQSSFASHDCILRTHGFWGIDVNVGGYDDFWGIKDES